MCGILGWISSNKIDQKVYVRFSAALDTMLQRGPDASGIVALSARGNRFVGSAVCGPEYLEKNCTALLGHRRLSILDLSPAGHQPMISQDGKLWITYNGEVFNYVELKAELEGLGISFLTQTDTEVVLVAYQHWGTDCFRRFNGMWGMAIVDLEKEVVHLSRDHFGIKPVYYIQNKQGLFFSSTIRSILQLSEVPRRPNAPLLYDFLFYGNDTCKAETYFEGVYEVPSAHFLTFDLREPNHPPEEVCWWKIGQNRIESDEPQKLFFELLEDSVMVRLRSDVSLGSCLSGGLDSSAIVAAMANKLGRDNAVRTITCCYEGSDYNEKRFAQQVVEGTGSIGHWSMPEKTHRLSDDLEHLVLCQEKPFLSLSVYSQYCVMREAKKAGITVLLDGQGGDELLLGYDRCHTIRLGMMVRSGQFRKAFQFVRQLCGNNEHFSLPMIFRWLVHDLMPQARSHYKNRTVGEFLDQEFLNVYRCCPAESLVFENLADFRYALTQDNPLPRLLHHEDRNSMAFSIEARLPLLDYRMADFVFNLPSEILMEDGWSKIFLRRYLDKAKMPEIAWRREKMGYSTPVAALMENSRAFLQDICSGVLKSERFIRSKRLKRLVNEEEFSDWHWRLLSVELWMQSMEVE